MTYSNRPLKTSTEQGVYDSPVEFSDRVHWGPILAGLVAAISTQLLLNGLGIALGLSTIAGSDAPRTDSTGVAQVVGTWSIISLFISLFVGGWITARSYGFINRSTAILNGAILWATTLAVSAWLLASGVSGTFGVALANNNNNIPNQSQPNSIVKGTPDSSTTQNPAPNLSAQQTRDAAGRGAKAAWGFTIGSLLGLAASIVGASAGARNVRNHRLNTNEV